MALNFDPLTGLPFLLPGEGQPAPAIPQFSDTDQGPPPPNDWGIYLSDSQVLKPDSIVEVEYRREWRLADYPMEEGAFETYDKVTVPFDIHLRVAKGGSQSDRATFLQALEDIGGTLDLYDVITPERTYSSVNIVMVGYSRRANSGAGLITAVLALRQVRVTAAAQFTNTKDPNAAATVNDGTVQTSVATPVEQSSVASSIAAASPAQAIDQTALAAAGPMQSIPLNAVASQVLNVTLGGVATRLAPYMRGSGLYMDVFLNDALAIGGAPCLSGVPILRDSYLGFPGDLVFTDTQGNSDPTIEGLGSRFSLLYMNQAATSALGLK